MASFLKKLAKQELFVPHVDRYLQKANFPAIWNFPIKPHKEPDAFFHPSGDCTPCARELYAKFNKDVPARAVDYTSHKNFMVGHFWHILLQDIFVATGMADESAIECKVNMQSRSGWKAVGSADVSRAKSPGSDTTYLVDFKTQNSRFFANDVKPDLLEKWRYQVNCYMDWVHKKEKIDLPEAAVIFVIQKDSPHNFKEVLIPYEPDILLPIYSKWSDVHKALEENYPPECDCALGSCPMEDIYTRCQKS